MNAVRQNANEGWKNDDSFLTSNEWPNNWCRFVLLLGYVPLRLLWIFNNDFYVVLNWRKTLEKYWDNHLKITLPLFGPFFSPSFGQILSLASICQQKKIVEFECPICADSEDFVHPAEKCPIEDRTALFGTDILLELMDFLLKIVMIFIKLLNRDKFSLFLLENFS